MSIEKDYDERPWGNYKVLLREPGMWIKRIEVKSGARLSLQKHQHRAEQWIVTHGRGMVTRNEESISVKTGAHVEIALGDVHRIENQGSTPLIFVEVALGDEVREDDIQRLEDDYGRI